MPQLQQVVKCRRQAAQRQIGEAVPIEMPACVVQPVGDRQAQRGQRRRDTDAGRKAVRAVHQHAHTGARQRQRRQQEPWRPPRPASAVRGPVQIGPHPGGGDPGRIAHRLDQTGNLVRVLAAIAQQHQERADLIRVGLPGQHHRHCLARLRPRQRPRTAGSASQGGDECGEARGSGSGGVHQRLSRRRRRTGRPARGPSCRRRGRGCGRASWSAWPVRPDRCATRRPRPGSSSSRRRR